MFFQPAEETVGGAKMMIEAGCIDNPKVDHVLGLHVRPTLEVGEVGFTTESVMQQVIRLTIKVRENKLMELIHKMGLMPF